MAPLLIAGILDSPNDASAYWHDEHPSILIYTHDRLGVPRPQRVMDLEFTGKGHRVFYHLGGQTLPNLFLTREPYESVTSYRNVRFSQTLTLLFRLGSPFFETHEDRANSCRRTYLAVGVATHREEGWAVACILRSEVDVVNCDHVLDLDQGQELDNWEAVARLWGYQEPTNTLGGIVAVSKSGTRIAIVNWNVLYVWALEPDALIEDNRNGFYPPSMRSSQTGMIELRPVALRLGAVCFKLRFHEDNKLVAITDRGVMHWDLNPLGRGEKSTHSLKRGQLSRVNNS